MQMRSRRLTRVIYRAYRDVSNVLEFTPKMLYLTVLSSATGPNSDMANCRWTTPALMCAKASAEVGTHKSLSNLRVPFSMRSFTRPGVPTTTSMPRRRALS